jgi:hypothetical protein
VSEEKTFSCGIFYIKSTFPTRSTRMRPSALRSRSPLDPTAEEEEEEEEENSKALTKDLVASLRDTVRRVCACVCAPRGKVVIFLFSQNFDTPDFVRAFGEDIYDINDSR